MTSEQSVRAVPTDHTGLRVLSLEDCLARLVESPVGRFAFHLDGEIAVLPVNHVLDGVDVCFRTLGDSKIQAAIDEAGVAFQVDGYQSATRDGWSVLVQGTAAIVSDPAAVRRLESIARRPWVPTALEPMIWIRVRSHSITGRALLHA